MAITRKYESIEECARLYVNEAFDNIDSSLITDNPNWFENWEFLGYLDQDEAEEYAGIDPGEYDPDELYPTDQPMWNIWFEVSNSWDAQWIEEHTSEIARLGFTIIYREGYLWGLGIDGAGYSFYDAHWIPLYRLRGLTWHED